jgi:hypothetical protein
MVTLWSEGLNLVDVFNSRSGCKYAMNFLGFVAKLPILKLKTRPKKLLGYLLSAFAFQTFSSNFIFWGNSIKKLQTQIYCNATVSWTRLQYYKTFLRP